MKKIIWVLLMIGCLSFLGSCSGGGGGAGVYRYHHGYGPWWGSRDYYRDRVIIVPPEAIEPPLEATPLPAGPEHMPDVDIPDMGMPDIDLGGF